MKCVLCDCEITDGVAGTGWDGKTYHPGGGELCLEPLKADRDRLRKALEEIECTTKRWNSSAANSKNPFFLDVLRIARAALNPEAKP